MDFFLLSSVIVDNSSLGVSFSFFAPLRAEWLARRAPGFLSETYGSVRRRTGVWDHRGLKRNLLFSSDSSDQIFQFQGYGMTMASIKSILGEAGH